MTDAVLNYVVLLHEGIADPHFDLMFEASPGSALTTWRSAHWPIDAPTSVEKLEDHRAAYLTYEGPLFGDRGRVKRIEAGRYRSTIDPKNPLVCYLSLENGTRLRLRCPRTNEWMIEPASIA